MQNTAEIRKQVTLPNRYHASPALRHCSVCLILFVLPVCLKLITSALPIFPLFHPGLRLLATKWINIRVRMVTVG